MDETNFVEDSVSRLQCKDCTVTITPLQLSKRITQTVDDMISFLWKQWNERFFQVRTRRTTTVDDVATLSATSSLRATKVCCARASYPDSRDNKPTRSDALRRPCSRL